MLRAAAVRRNGKMPVAPAILPTNHNTGALLSMESKAKLRIIVFDAFSSREPAFAGP